MTDSFIRIQGWDRLVEAHLKLMEGMKPSGGFGEGIHQMGMMGRAIAESKTHRVTSALSQSHRVKFSRTGGFLRGGGPEAEVYVIPLRNPISGIPTTDYAGIEDARGGAHAFYEIVVDKHADLLFRAFAQPFARAIGF